MTRMREAYAHTSENGDKSFDALYGANGDALFEDTEDLIDPKFKKLFENVYQTNKKPNYRALREECNQNPPLESGGQAPCVTQSEPGEYDAGPKYAGEKGESAGPAGKKFVESEEYVDDRGQPIREMAWGDPEEDGWDDKIPEMMNDEPKGDESYFDDEAWDDDEAEYENRDAFGVGGPTLDDFVDDDDYDPNDDDDFDEDEEEEIRSWDDDQVDYDEDDWDRHEADMADDIDSHSIDFRETSDDIDPLDADSLDEMAEDEYVDDDEWEDWN